MHRGKHNLVHDNTAVIAANHDIVLPGTHSHGPNPVLPFAQITEHNTLTAPKLNFLATATEDKIVTTGKEINTARIEFETVLTAIFLTRDLVERKCLIPAANDQHICGIGFRLHGIPRKCPDGSLANHVGLLLSELVSDADVATEEAQSYMKAIICPGHAQDLGVHLSLGHRLLLWRPEAQVRSSSARKLLRDGVVCKALNRLVVIVLQNSLSLVSPNDDLLISTTRCELFSMPGVGNAEDTLLVPLQRVDEIAICGIVNQNPVPRCYDDLRAIGLEGNAPNAVAPLLPLGNLVLP
mmetsp:Transcript_104276/g.185338  ORF Transcript_104276/g.185338 Transcript_104276/m.185338 type:complete len:296 (-) Transcript_104276:126-1013(-)